jgi:hypothetical protein
VIEPTDEMRAAFRAEREDSCDEIGCGRDDCLNERLAAVLAIVARDQPDPVEALRAAYWKLRGHASSYRSTDVFRRRQESFRADPDNAVFARGAARDEWYARGIEAGADDFAELLDLEYDAHIEPDADGAP